MGLMDVLSPHLRSIHRGFLARAYVPSMWGDVKLMYIPKPWESTYMDAKRKSRIHGYRKCFQVALVCNDLFGDKTVSNRHLGFLCIYYAGILLSLGTFLWLL